MKSFYDEQQNPLEIGVVLAHCGIFLIATLPQAPGEKLLGLFVEDDESFHLRTRFSTGWLPELRLVADWAKEKIERG